MKKNFKLCADDILALIPPGGACMASDLITVAGQSVFSMHREAPNHPTDTGWVFMSGREDQEYADDPKNWAIFELNTLANYDRAIIPYLAFPVGTCLERVPGTLEFRSVGEQPNQRG